MINDFTLWMTAIAFGLMVACFLLDRNDEDEL